MINQRQRQEREQRLEHQSRHLHSSSSTVEHRVHSNGRGLERAERHYEYEEQATGQVGFDFGSFRSKFWREGFLAKAYFFVGF